MSDPRRVVLAEDARGQRLDKALAERLNDLSRARLQALIAEGRLTRDGLVITDGATRAVPGDYELSVPPPLPATPEVVEDRERDWVTGSGTQTHAIPAMHRPCRCLRLVLCRQPQDEALHV